MLKNNNPYFLPFLLFFLLHTTTNAQSPATAPAPAGPTNVTKILEKAGQFNTLIRLMKATKVSDQLPGQLNNSNNGLTIFAPTDNAFATLKPGTLNSLTDQQQVELIQFHIIPTFLTTTSFQTVSNPLRTQAGDSGGGHFPLNVTTSGNAVNITSGLTNTTVSGTVYTDNQLAVYQVDQVLLPLQIFAPSPPAPAPAPVKSKKKRAEAVADGPDGVDASSGEKVIRSMQINALFLLGIAGYYYL